MRTLSFAAGFIAFSAFVVVASSSSSQHRREEQKVSRSVVYVRRDPESGLCSLTARDYLLQGATVRPRIFRLLSLWRYDPSARRWNKEQGTDDKPVEIRDPNPKIRSWEADQPLFALPAAIALFWAEWSEDERVVSSLAVSGPVLCNDIEIGNPPTGMIAACVPSLDSAQASFVPDPAIHCRP